MWLVPGLRWYGWQASALGSWAGWPGRSRFNSPAETTLRRWYITPSVSRSFSFFFSFFLPSLLSFFLSLDNNLSHNDLQTQLDYTTTSVHNVLPQNTDIGSHKQRRRRQAAFVPVFLALTGSLRLPRVAHVLHVVVVLLFFLFLFPRTPYRPQSRAPPILARPPADTVDGCCSGTLLPSHAAADFASYLHDLRGHAACYAACLVVRVCVAAVLCVTDAGGPARLLAWSAAAGRLR